MKANRVLTLRVLIMAWVMLAGIIGTGLIGPNRPAVEDQYGLSHWKLGLGIAIVQISCAVVFVLCAPRLKRFNLVKVLGTGVAVQAVGLVLVFGTRHLGWLAAGWLLVTLGTVAGAVTNTISMDLWKKNPRMGVTLAHAFNAGGKVLGPLIVATVFAIYKVSEDADTWRHSFLWVGGIAVAVAVAYFALVRGPEADYGITKAEGDTGAGLALLRKPFYWLSMSTFGMIAGGEAAFATLITTYLHEVKGFEKTTANLYFMVHLLGLMAGRFISAPLKEKVSNHVIIACCLAAGVCVFPAVLVDNSVIRLAGLFIFGIMFSTTWPTCFAQLAQFFPRDREMLAYGSGLGNYIGISLCILASSIIADVNLTVSLFFGPVVLWVFGVLYFVLIVRRKEPIQ